jgi:hypothetical protein
LSSGRVDEVFDKAKNKPDEKILTASLFFESFVRERALFALMSVLSQSFFTLVRRHLMSFLLFTAGHNCDDLFS